jgi:hypothetical protein
MVFAHVVIIGEPSFEVLLTCTIAWGFLGLKMWVDDNKESSKPNSDSETARFIDYEIVDFFAGCSCHP